MATKSALKHGGAKFRSMVEGAADGVTGALKVNDPWQKTSSMDDVMKYEPPGDINPKKTAQVGARSRGLKA